MLPFKHLLIFILSAIFGLEKNSMQVNISWQLFEREVPNLEQLCVIKVLGT
jgi:hypothetical protein